MAARHSSALGVLNNTTMMRTLFFVLSCFVAVANAVTANYEMGVEAYNKGEYQKAYNLLLPEAEHGNTNAQFRIGYLLQNGLGVEKNPKQALVWLRKAAERGDFVAQSHLGVSYSEGNGVEKNLIEAYAWTDASNRNYEHKITAAQLEVIKSRMTPEQITKAKVLANSYYSQYVKPFSK